VCVSRRGPWAQAVSESRHGGANYNVQSYAWYTSICPPLRTNCNTVTADARDTLMAHMAPSYISLYLSEILTTEKIDGWSRTRRTKIDIMQSTSRCRLCCSLVLQSCDPLCSLASCVILSQMVSQWTWLVSIVLHHNHTLDERCYHIYTTRLGQSH
jgi:hypothetical protein